MTLPAIPAELSNLHQMACSMIPELRISYRADDDWTGQLNAAVTSGAFSGMGSAWFDRKAIQEGLIVALRQYPLSADSPPKLQGGFLSKAHQGKLDQCHLRIQVRPYNLRGTLLVQTDLATEKWILEDSDKQQSVTTRFLTDYHAIDLFAVELGHVLDGQLDQAILFGNAP